MFFSALSLVSYQSVKKWHWKLVLALNEIETLFQLYFRQYKMSQKLLFQNWDAECENEHAVNDKYKGRYIAVLVIMLLSWLVIIGLFMYSRRVPIKHAIFN